MKENLLYLTFPEGLSESNPELDAFIDVFARRLQQVLERLLGDSLKVVAKGADFQESDKYDMLRKASRVMFFMHPEFAGHAEYIHELEQAAEQLGIQKVDHIMGCPQLYKISLAPLKNPLESEVLERLISYDFFERNIFNRRIRLIDIQDDSRTSVIYSKLLDLGYDIKTSIKGDGKIFKLENELERTVYLALTSYDQEAAREDIRRELIHYGYRVLPAINMPAGAEAFREVLLENLNYCSTVVQMMGANYGDILKGSKYSLPDYQNLVIREFQQQADEDKFRRYIWLPLNMKVTDQRQSLYIKRLRRDDAGVSTEVIESPLETFKTILSARLSSGGTVKKEDFGNLSKVYVLTEDEQAEEFRQLVSTLSLSGLKVITLDFDEQIGLYARHLQALRDSDGIIVYQQGSNGYWLSSKLRDIIKSPGIGRKKPFQKIIISSGIEPDENLVRMIRSEVEWLQPNGANPEIILQKLTTA